MWGFEKAPRYPGAFRLDHVGESESFCPLLFLEPRFYNQIRSHHRDRTVFPTDDSKFGLEIFFTFPYMACVALLIKRCLKSSFKGVGGGGVRRRCCTAYTANLSTSQIIPDDYPGQAILYLTRAKLWSSAK